MIKLDTPKQQLARAAEMAVEAITASLLQTGFKLSLNEREIIEERIKKVLESIEGLTDGLIGDARQYAQTRIVEELEEILDERMDELA